MIKRERGKQQSESGKKMKVQKKIASYSSRALGLSPSCPPIISLLKQGKTTKLAAVVLFVTSQGLLGKAVLGRPPTAGPFRQVWRKRPRGPASGLGRSGRCGRASQKARKARPRPLFIDAALRPPCWANFFDLTSAPLPSLFRMARSRVARGLKKQSRVVRPGCGRLPQKGRLFLIVPRACQFEALAKKWLANSSLKKRFNLGLIGPFLRLNCRITEEFLMLTRRITTELLMKMWIILGVDMVLTL